MNRTLGIGATTALLSIGACAQIADTPELRLELSDFSRLLEAEFRRVRHRRAGADAQESYRGADP